MFFDQAVYNTVLLNNTTNYIFNTDHKDEWIYLSFWTSTLGKKA